MGKCRGGIFGIHYLNKNKKIVKDKEEPTSNHRRTTECVAFFGKNTYISEHFRKVT